jgi:N-acetylmuramoyl-L-alanine amidase
LIGTGLQKRIIPAVNFEDRLGGVQPTILLMHYTGMEDAARACAWLCSDHSRVSCHYLVDEAGEITQMVSEDKRAWHAGVSSWAGTADVNSHSIGIEVQNAGHSGGYPDFPTGQMKRVAALARDVVERWSIAPRRVLAHSDVAPGRKVDPGEKFDWAFLHRSGVGHWAEPAAVSEGPLLRLGQESDAVAKLRQHLRSYGYGIEITGTFDLRTKQVVEAFQRHFRPAAVDGIADISTLATLERVLA